MADAKQDQKELALWAAECAEHVLTFFEEKQPNDDRPRQAIEAVRAWARGEIKVSEARAAAFAAHAAAREASDAAARAAARASGQAAGVAHVAGHAPHAADYAVKAVRQAAAPGDQDAAAAREREWQRECLPRRLERTLRTAARNDG
jgi:hypothetical protein